MTNKNNTSKISKYHHVSWAKNENKWLVKFTKNYQVIYLRYFENETDAGIVADYKAIEIYGTITSKNFKDLSFEQLRTHYTYLLSSLGSTRLEIKSTATQKERKIIGLSKYVGVTFDKRRNKWNSRVKKHGKSYYCGSHDLEVDAANAYNKKAIELYGDNARLNKIELNENN